MYDSTVWSFVSMFLRLQVVPLKMVITSYNIFVQIPKAKPSHGFSIHSYSNLSPFGYSEKLRPLHLYRPLLYFPLENFRLASIVCLYLPHRLVYDLFIQFQSLSRPICLDAAEILETPLIDTSKHVAKLIF